MVIAIVERDGSYGREPHSPIDIQERVGVTLDFFTNLMTLRDIPLSALLLYMKRLDRMMLNKYLFFYKKYDQKSSNIVTTAPFLSIFQLTM